MSEKQSFFFHLIPHDKVKRSDQALIVEQKNERVVAYEGHSAMADELFLMALIALENYKGNLPVLMVNQQDFDEGKYKTDYSDGEEEEKV